MDVFWQNVTSTFIGAFLGFCFSIVLFYLTTKLSNFFQKKSLKKNLVKEFEFNDHYLQKLVADLKKAIEKITVDDKNMFYYFNYISYQRLFVQSYFQQGFLYEKLDPEDINLVDTILTHMGQGIEQYINNYTKAWKDGSVDQKQILSVFQFERDTLEKYINDIRKIKAKI